jgi:hypothetical protein
MWRMSRIFHDHFLCFSPYSTFYSFYLAKAAKFILFSLNNQTGAIDLGQDRLKGPIPESIVQPGVCPGIKNSIGFVAVIASSIFFVTNHFDNPLSPGVFRRA